METHGWESSPILSHRSLCRNPDEGPRRCLPHQPVRVLVFEDTSTHGTSFSRPDCAFPVEAPRTSFTSREDSFVVGPLDRAPSLRCPIVLPVRPSLDVFLQGKGLHLFLSRLPGHRPRRPSSPFLSPRVHATRCTPAVGDGALPSSVISIRAYTKTLR